jgi:hypothetical protein
MSKTRELTRAVIPVAVEYGCTSVPTKLENASSVGMTNVITERCDMKFHLLSGKDRNMEGFAVMSGNLKKEDELHIISETARSRYNQHKTAFHEWIDTIDDTNYKGAIDTIRYSNEIRDAILEKFPNTSVQNVTEADEVYWAVSPKEAGYSDRSLVDCHYDSPFGWFPTGGVIFYRVIVAMNENETVTTIFPHEKKRVHMSTGDYHGLDYNKDYHCVEGQIPPGKHRVLLKLHYLITPKGAEGWNAYVRFINVAWTKVSRYAMRVSAKPTNPFEWFLAALVTICRVTFNNIYVILPILAVAVAVVIWKRPRGRRGKAKI